jgi:FkbH-like protein
MHEFRYPPVTTPIVLFAKGGVFPGNREWVLEYSAYGTPRAAEKYTDNRITLESVSICGRISNMSIQRGLDYFGILKEAKRLNQTRHNRSLRLAILGDCSTQQFVPMLRVFFGREGYEVEIYEGNFDAIELEVLNPESGLYRFGPDMVILLNAIQSLRDKFYERKSSSGEFQTAAITRITRTWDSLLSKRSPLIIQSNFVAPFERFFGNYDQKITTSFTSIVSQLNSTIAAEARTRSSIFVNDVEGLASWVGRKGWFDERLWTIAKSFCALDHLPLVSKNIVDIAMANLGKGIKCVVLDLDNTLWGGVVGDDGAQGVQIGAHGDGEPFYRLQGFLKELKNRGIILAVCSKNEEANAVMPFQENSGMILKLEDITVFMANWENKPDNIRKIAKILNIGLDSMVFLDDNRFEREAVRAFIPEVIVPELPEDPADYVKALSELNLFETSSFSAEDAQRPELYRQEAGRRIAESSAGNFEEFLQSLGMTIEVGRFTAEQLGRIAQLIQRSNQFNLTTQRHNQAQCEAMMNDVGGCLPLSVSLKDRFGDHGLISIVIARVDRQSETLILCDWLMSCRVLGRGVEEYLMNYTVEKAKELRLETISAVYIPTAKNAMVKEFYARFGFEKIAVLPDGKTEWMLKIEDYQPRKVFIRFEAPGAHLMESQGQRT